MSVHALSTPDAEVFTRETECFDVAIEANIAHIVLNRPDAFNAMNKAFWGELPDVIRDIDENARARVIVLSALGKHFCAGMDVSVFTDPKKDDMKGVEPGRRRAALMRNVLELQKTFSCLEEARMPVLMAVQGACIGGGVDFASACDMRYCTKDAFFCIHEINIGMTADVGTYPRLPHLMPQGLVRELSYTGRRLYAEEAAQAGFVNRVFDTHEEMLAEVMRLAGEIAGRSPLAVWGSKEAINYARDHSVGEGLKQIALWQSGMFHPGDMAESFKALGEKRDPKFQNLLPVKTKDLI